MSGALDHIRVLDLTSELGWFCGKLFAGLGARVTRIEPPTGDPGRDVGPFSGAGLSLHFEAGNAAKRSIGLDVHSTDGRRALHRLVKNTDILLDSGGPGFLDPLGLSWEEVQVLNPRIVQVSITPFGLSGPYHSFRASDLTLQSMGGLAWLCGDADRAPTGLGAPQTAVMAGAQAAIGALLGYMQSRKEDRAVLIDLSAQEALTWGMIPTRQIWELSHQIINRAGPARSFSDRRIRVIYECRDGHAAVFGVIGRELPTLVAWLDDVGIEHDLHDEHWSSLSRAGTAAANQADFDHVADYIAALAMRYAREEFAAEAQKRRIIVYPVYGPVDLLQHSCLIERGFFEDVTLASGEVARLPGAPFRFSETPWRTERAPACGDRGIETLKDAGFSDVELEGLHRQGVLLVAPNSERPR